MPLLDTTDGNRPDLSLTFGAIQVGLLIALVLQGICTQQVWNYYRHYPKDPLYLKILVAVVAILDLGHSGLGIHVMYYYTIQCFGDYACLEKAVPSMSMSVALSGFVSFCVQAFYCLRVYHVTGSKLLSIWCFSLATTHCGFTLAVVCRIFQAEQLEGVQHGFRWLIVSALIDGVIADTVIAVCMCWGLLRHRSGVEPTNRMIDRLVTFVIASGLLTGLAAVTEAFVYLFRDDFIWLAFFAVLSKLYSNSFMVSLNERRALHSISYVTSTEVCTKEAYPALLSYLFPGAVSLPAIHKPPKPSPIMFAKSVVVTVSSGVFEVVPHASSSKSQISLDRTQTNESRDVADDYFPGRETV